MTKEYEQFIRMLGSSSTQFALMSEGAVVKGFKVISVEVEKETITRHKIETKVQGPSGKIYTSKIERRLPFGTEKGFGSLKK